MQGALFLCDGAEVPPSWARESWDTRESLNHTGSGPEVNLKIENLSHTLLSQLEMRESDLVRIAAYVYAADQSVSRGGEADVYGRNWRRRMALCIPVSEPKFWGTEAIGGALAEVLNFLSDDRWEFQFSPMRIQAEQLVSGIPEQIA